MGSPAGAPVAGAASPSTAVGDFTAGTPGAGAAAVQAQVQQVAGQVRQLGQLAQQLAQTNPAIAPEMQQIAQILKAATVKVAQAAMQQTPSGAAAPSGGASM